MLGRLRISDHKSVGPHTPHHDAPRLCRVAALAPDDVRVDVGVMSGNLRLGTVYQILVQDLT